MAPPFWTVGPRALWPILVAVGVGALLYFVVGEAVGGFTATVMRIAGINIVLAVSLTVVNGFTGQFSMGHAGLMAVGGYVAAALTYYGSMRLFGSADPAGGILSLAGPAEATTPVIGRGDILFLISCLVGGLAAAGAGYLVGLPSLRLRGDYLAIVTLGFGEIVRVLLQGTPDQIQPWRAAEAQEIPWYELPLKLGGPKGFNLLPTYTTLFWVYFFVTITLIVCYRLKTSSAGRAFLAIREDEVAAQAMGVNITKYKVRAFVLASFFAGLAGGLYAMDIGAINAGDLGFLKSFEVIIMVVLGGMGSISGAALAAIILTILPELLRAPPPVWPAGLVLLAIVAALQFRRGKWRVVPLVVIAVAPAILEGARQYCLATAINLADFRLMIYAFALVLMMILRPEGLLGLREIWELWRPRSAPGGPSTSGAAA